jgi:predicted permease
VRDGLNPFWRPPRLAVTMLRRLLPRDLRDDILDDLRSRYADLVVVIGPRRARRWYWSQTLRSIVPALQHGRLELLFERAPRQGKERLAAVAQEISSTLRQVRRDPGFVCVAVLTLAIGIAATVTIFGAIDIWLFHPLPYDDAEALMHVYGTEADRSVTTAPQSIPDFLDMRDLSSTLRIASHYGYSFNLSGQGEPERIDGERVSWNYFQVLEVQPALGRTFLPDEERFGQHRVCILSDGLWRRRFAADPEILGSSILLDGEPHTVVGILAPSFWSWRARYTSEIWTPFGVTGLENRGSYMLTSIARLGPGISEEEANAEVAGIAGHLANEHPDSNQGLGAGVRPLHDLIFGEQATVACLIAMVAAGFVLLIACSNIASLMLTRVIGRGREIAVQRALGAGVGRIMRQLFAEAAVISILAGLVGVAMSFAGVRALVSIMPTWFPFAEEIGINGRVLAFAMLVTLTTPLMFALAPAVQIAQPYLAGSLREGSRGSPGGKADRLRKFFVVAEVSLAATLLVSSALLVRGFYSVQSADYGFNEQRLLTFEVSLPENRYPDDISRTGFYRYLMWALESLPGVDAVGGTSSLPFRSDNNTEYVLPGRAYAGPGRNPLASYRFVFPGYFDAMQTAIVHGRPFTADDSPRSPPVVIVNEALANRHWPDGSALGERIVLWGVSREIVGVAQDTVEAIGQSRAMLFVSAFQSPETRMSLVVRTQGDPASLVAGIRDEVYALDSNLPIHSVASMADLKADELGESAVMAKIMAALAGLALLLAMVGVYGVMSYSVSRRTQEMGIRMALGAQRSHVLRMVIRQGATLALMGVVAGFFVASLVTESLSVFLFGMEPFDPLTFAIAALALLAAGIVASYVPAQRATRADPLEALRSE